MSTSPWTDPPRPRSMLPSREPGPRSIFTLRPNVRSERPPPEPRHSKRRAWSRALAAVAISGSVLVAWSLAPHRESSETAPIVYVNGTPKVKQTPSGKTERWAQASELTLYVDASVDQIGPGAR